MAVESDGFSIRGYAAKMRSVDVAKCWPFKDDDDGGRLPPMAVAKFRWWAHELARLRRGQTPEPSSKPKSKPAKERSIAEIFAVAPQIDPDDIDGDRVLVSDLRESRNGTKKKKKKKKKKKRKSNSVSKEANCVGVFIKKMKNSDHHGSIIAIKKNAQKFKLKNRVNFAKKLKKFAIHILDSDSASGKKPSGRCSSVQDKQKGDESSGLILKNPEPTLPIRSILKNHTSCEPRSTIHIEQHDCDVNPCGIQSSEKHVRFSGQNDFFGPKKTSFCSPEQNVGKSLSEALDSSSEAVKSAENNEVASEANESGHEDSVGSDYEIEVQPEIREQLGDNPCIELPSSPGLRVPVQANSRALPEKNAGPACQGSFHDNNLQVLDESYQTASARFTHTPSLFSTLNSSRGNTQVGGSVFRIPNCNGRLTNIIQDPIYTVAEMNPIENTRRLLEPVSFFPVNGNENLRIRSQLLPDEEIVTDHSSCCRPYCRPHPMDLIGGLNSLPQPEWKQNAVVFRKTSSDDDFFGLPLNSHGELIQSSSRPKCLYNEAGEMSIIGSSTGFFPARSHTQPASTGEDLGARKDQENLFLAQNYARENQSFQLPARLGVSYLQSCGRADIHQLDLERSNISLRPVDADLNIRNITFDGGRPYGHVYSPKMNEKTHQPNENSATLSLNAGQPTMRLMGKDVPICKSSNGEQGGFDDSNLWTDKEIIVEHCPSGSSSATTNFHKWIPQVKYRETVQQSQAHGEMSAQNHFLVKPLGSGVSHRCIDWQASDVFQTNRNTSPNYLPFTHSPDSSSTIFNGAPHFRDFFVSEAEPLQRCPHQLPVLSNPRESYEHVHWRPAELTQNRQNLPHISKPRFEFPFSDPGARANYTQLPRFQNPQSLPSWLLHAKQQGKTPMISSHQQPRHFSSRTNIFNTPSVYHLAEGAYYPCNYPGPSSQHPQSRAQRGSASIDIPSHISVSTAYRNRMKVKERLKSKSLGIKDLCPGKKANKKLAATKPADSIIPARSMLNLERRDNRLVAVQCDAAIDGLSSTECYSTEANGVAMIKNSGNESLRVVVDGMGRSRAKHILEPNQSSDLVGNFVPVHSTNPFIPAASVSRVTQESQNKATKIYRFY